MSIRCPRCNSNNIEVTCKGSIYCETILDPNRAVCVNCKHSGNAGDWYLIDLLISKIGGDLYGQEER